VQKSAETIEKKRVEFFSSARERKRVRKSLKGKEIALGTLERLNDEMSGK
jgi:hypothetical protein